MQLHTRQLDEYHRNGLVVLPSLFTEREISALRAAFAADCEEPGGTDIYAAHQRRPEFAALVRSPRLLRPARQLACAQLYVYQFKINAKPAFAGGSAWHQDFPAWHQADSLPEPRLVTVGLFLDDVTEFNRPLLFVPGSHRAGSFGEPAEGHLDREQLTELVRMHGMTGPRGPAGSVVFFHPEVVHGSAPNMSPFPRKLLLITYNDVRNPPNPQRDTTPSTVQPETPIEVLA